MYFPTTTMINDDDVDSDDDDDEDNDGDADMTMMMMMYWLYFSLNPGTWDFNICEKFETY